MAPEQGPDSKNAPSGKTSQTTTNELGSGQEKSNETQSTHNTLQTDSLGWVYLLRKDKLIEVCRQYNIPITDRATVDQLRRQLIELIRLKRQRASSENLLRSLEEEVLNEERKPLVDEQVTIQVPSIDHRKSSSNTLSDAEVMSTIRRWDLTYDGGDDLMEFVERLEELADCYGFNRSRLLFSLLEILRNKALQWYRVKREQIVTWEQFKEEASRFFLPKRYHAHLEENIYHRKQGPREKAKDYIMSLQALIRQHPELKKLNHTDRIYDGLRCEYKLYVRRSDFNSLDELMELTDEYELLRKDEAKQGKPQPNHYIDVSPHNYRRETHCWHCKQPGHFRAQCSDPGRIFCSWCGKDDVMSRDCVCVRGETNLDGRFYLTISIFNTPIRALVDTGANLTYIGQTVRHLLETHNVRPRSHQRTLQLADGSYISSANVYPLVVEANGKITHLLASSLDTLAEPIILGMDFLRRRKATLLIDGIKLQAVPSGSTNQLHTVHSIFSRDILKPEQKNQLQTVLASTKASFAAIQGPCNMGKHVIHMQHNRPIKQRYYPRNPAMQSIINQEVDELIALDRIEPSCSPYSGDSGKMLSCKMERKPTRPLAPGQIKKYLRQTVMPRHIPALLPTFEARPKIHTVESAPLAQSGNMEVDRLAQKVWDKRVVNPLYCVSDGPPPLAPLSTNATIQKNDTLRNRSQTTELAPPLCPIATADKGKADNLPPVKPPKNDWMGQHEDDFQNDVLALSTADLSEEEESEDLFKGIIIDIPPNTKLTRWMIYPKGRPKVEVRVKRGMVRLRCQGKVKTFAAAKKE